MKTAACLCGGVKFELHGPLDDVIACHCTQCRKQTGNYWASTHTADVDLRMVSEDTLSWYRSSEKAQRGFCKTCGSTLFWKTDGSDHTSVCVGSIDGASGLKLGGHIYVDDAGDYYEISGGAYRKARWE
jgi:hypothetical protein